jgi:hypothetical protein
VEDITTEGICLNFLILNVVVLFRFLSRRISVLEAKGLSEDMFRQGTALDSKHKTVGGEILEMFALQVSCCAHLFDLSFVIKCSVYRFLPQV